LSRTGSGRKSAEVLRRSSERRDNTRMKCRKARTDLQNTRMECRKARESECFEQDRERSKERGGTAAFFREKAKHEDGVPKEDKNAKEKPGVVPKGTGRIIIWKQF